MSFIKGTGAILIVFAIFASSCNKQSHVVYPYRGTKLDVFAANFRGVTVLVTDAIVLKDTVTHLQKVILTLPETSSNSKLKTALATINSRIDSIVSTLNKMANNGTATKGVIDSLKNDLTTLLFKVGADDNILKTQITALGSINIIQSARLNALVKTNNALVVQIANAQKSLNNLIAYSGDAATQVAVDALSVQMNAAKICFNILLTTYQP
jgi:hypothetical protein